MQYVRSISGSVSKTWNSINPATLSGAIDVIVVELEDGSLACSPFHVRFGKFSLLRPYEKKVEFWVNNVKQDFSMKLGEGGEAFFIFEATGDVPEALLTSPLVSPALTPKRSSGEGSTASLQEPEYLDLETQTLQRPSSSAGKPSSGRPVLSEDRRAQSDTGGLTPLSRSVEASTDDALATQWNSRPTAYPMIERSKSDHLLPAPARLTTAHLAENERLTEQATQTAPSVAVSEASPTDTEQRRSRSPPPVPTKEAVDRANALSKKLSGSNIPSRVNESGDLMLDMTGYKTSEEEALRAEVIARRLLAEELEGNYDTGALIGSDDSGNLWVYSSEEAKEAATARKSDVADISTVGQVPSAAASDPGYPSDGEQSSLTGLGADGRHHAKRLTGDGGLITPPRTPADDLRATESKSYAKTLRLTSEQLKALGLKPGANSMRFSVNRATCTAYMYFWKYNASIVISDIDGTITKSDALGHVLNMIGRDWTHQGVAKLYSDIVANGYHIMYLTSRSIGQADTTRNYLNSVVQDIFRLPKGPVILSPDRTIAALRREVYLRKPEVFKMACLRDIHHLFGPGSNPFYAGFGNRLTDALSYRSVNIPSTRIFTINSNAEVSLDLLSLSKYKSSYLSMQELVDHFFPAVGTLVTRGGESYTDFNFWKEEVLDPSDFSASETDDDGEEPDDADQNSEDEGSEGLDEGDSSDHLEASYFSQGSGDNLNDSMLSELGNLTLEGATHDRGSTLDAAYARMAEEAMVEDLANGSLEPDTLQSSNNKTISTTTQKVAKKQHGTPQHGHASSSLDDMNSPDT